MRYFINLIFRIRNRFFKKQEEISRASISYDTADEVGILFSFQKQEQYQALNDFVSHLRADGKKVSILSYADQDDSQFCDFEYQRFTSKDITLSGKIRSREARDFADSRFDYLYCVNVDRAPVLEDLLRKSQAKCRMGRFFKSRRDCLDLMVDLKGRPEEDHLMKDMMRYTQTFSHRH